MEKVYTRLIKDKDYYDIAKFAEELFFSDCDLIILMARKFFTLYMIFQQLNAQKYSDLGIPYSCNKEKKIITNVALPLYEDKIRRGDFRKIVIADDIIIHGRSVSELYKTLKDWNEQSDVKIVSFLRNDEDTIFYKDIQSNFKARYLAESDYWKMMSTKIVDSFYETGRPYISYLPYFTIDNSWDELIGQFDEQYCYEIDNETMRYHEVKGKLYTGDILKDFQKQEYCKICGLRLYHYEKIDKVVVVPYFVMDVIRFDAFNDLSESLRERILTVDYVQRAMANHGADEMRLVELEYVLSYWMARIVIERLNLAVNEWNCDSEEYSFGMRILNDRTPSTTEIKEYLSQLSESIKDMKVKVNADELINNAEIAILAERYKALADEYSERAGDWANSRHWNDDYSYERRFLEELLSVNGKLDEKRLNGKVKNVKESNVITKDTQFAINDLREGNGTDYEKWLNAGKKRLLGLPLAFILQNLGSRLNDVSSESLERTKSRIFAAVLSVVDSGKGSIFTRIVKSHNNSDGCYYESLVHAGEQNFVFYDNANFPIMYAFYMIEQSANGSQIEGYENKVDFLNCFKEYLEKNHIYYDDVEMEQLMEINMTQKYGRYLQYTYYRHENNQTFNYAVKKASEIIRQ